ncbi:MAG TPA: TerC family protein [Phycisphaerales bacterium]|nr:TerC family protein [Phycisphaerales bacterium]
MIDILLVAQQTTGDGSLKVWAYAGFMVLVLAFLALDLGVFHREAHEVSMKEAASWSVVWVVCALLFCGFVYFAYEHHWLGLGLSTPMYNPLAATDPSAPTIVLGEVRGLEAAEQYLAGYVVEKSLAMDNIFVIAMLFSFFAVPGKYQHRVLFWGILGALAMRAGMIFLGAELVVRYTWVLIIFGLFLVLTAVKMAVLKSEGDPAKNPVIRLVSKVMPVVPFMDGQRFFTRRTVAPTYSTNAQGAYVQNPAPTGTLRAGGLFSGGWAATPLFLALVMVEVTDLIFAVDSIPAIFAITPDPFIVFTSNIFAILGLRSLYFCLAALISKFRLLKPALILILAFVGVKLLLLSLPPYLDDMGIVSEPMKSIKIGTTTSLGVVVGVLAAAVGLSALLPARRTEPGA